MNDSYIIQVMRHCGKFSNDMLTCKGCPADGDGCAGAYLAAADRLEALLAENERLKAQLPKWVSVKERLPETELETATADEPDDAITCEISVRVLVVDRTGKVRVARYELGPYFQGWQENGRAVGEVTHWMPLPSTEEVPYEDS